MSPWIWITVAVGGPSVEALAALDAELEAFHAAWRPPDWASLDPDVLALHLDQLRDIDQRVRSTQPPSDWTESERSALRAGVGARMGAIDQTTTEAMRALLASGAWPTLSEHGPQACLNAWLLVQHADRDVAFQKEVLAVMRPLVAAEAYPARHLAYLEDRVAVNEDRPQTYGTQGRCGDDARWTPKAVVAPEALDARRAEVGLGPMADYQDRFDCAGHQAAGMNLLRAEDYPGCQAAFTALAQNKGTAAGRRSPLYNAACCASLGGDLDAGFDLIRRALADGWTDRAKLQTDPDLANLRADRRWQTLPLPTEP